MVYFAHIDKKTWQLYILYIYKNVLFPPTSVVYFFIFCSVCVIILSICLFFIPFLHFLLVVKFLYCKGFVSFSTFSFISCRRKSFNFFFPCLSSPIFPYILFLSILLLYTDAYIFYLPAGHGKFGSIFP